LSVEVVAALLLDFLSSTALWWLYIGQVAGTVLDASARPRPRNGAGSAATSTPTYLHLPIVAGIVLVAVGDEFVIAHPTDELHDAGALVMLGGHALFLGGLMACAARRGHAESLPRAVAVVALVAALPLAGSAGGLVVSALLTALLAVLVLVEQRRDTRR
jgi:low temperature requirement protein LtrA